MEINSQNVDYTVIVFLKRIFNMKRFMFLVSYLTSCFIHHDVSCMNKQEISYLSCLEQCLENIRMNDVNINLEGTLYYANAHKTNVLPYTQEQERPKDYQIILQLLENKLIRIDPLEEARRQNPQLGWDTYEELSIGGTIPTLNITVNGLPITQACQSIITYIDNESVFAIPDGVTLLADKNWINTEYSKYHCDIFRDIIVDTIIFPGSLKVIRTRTCALCGVKNVIIHEGITEIESYAFDCCPSLYKISIPKSVKVIHNNAFSIYNSIRELEFNCVPKYKHTINQKRFLFFNHVPTLNKLKLPEIRHISIMNRGNCVLVLMHVEGKKVVHLANMPLAQNSDKPDEIAIIELGTRYIKLTKQLFNRNQILEF